MTSTFPQYDCDLQVRAQDNRIKELERRLAAMEKEGEMKDTLTHCKCGRRLTVIESRRRVIGGVQTVWRRKKCPEHGGRLTTIELDEALALEVLQDD